jgi:purine nucleosidase
MPIPTSPERRARVIVDTDAKNECDDQFAIVHALLTPSFEIPTVIAAHFGTRRGDQSMRESRVEIDHLIDLMALTGTIQVDDGGTHAMTDRSTAVSSPGAEAIVREAMLDDPRPLHVAFYGPLTDMAAALVLEPRIAGRNVRVVWIGGGPYPGGGPEFNLSNDVIAADVVFGSGLEVWQVPRPVYELMPVGYAELEEKVGGCGRLGRYLVDQVVEFNATQVEAPMEYRSLGDSPAVGVIIYPNCGTWTMRPAPKINDDMTYTHDAGRRPIRVYESVDARFVHEDFFAKLRRHTRW